MNQPTRKNLFVASLFFVLGFSLVFALLGVLLQTVLSSVGYTVQEWVARVGGVIIILFGLMLTGLLQIPWLMREHKLSIAKRVGSVHVTSFLFGAGFAAGWTPCVGAALGAILGLAATSPSSAFLLLLAYTLGLGIPFLIVGMFADKARPFLSRMASKAKIVSIVFGILLVAMGVLIFTGQLSRVANFAPIASLFVSGGTDVGSGIESLSLLNLAFAFIAGLVSFLSPCVLPLIPAFLTYLASVAAQEHGAEHASRPTKKDEIRRA